MVKMINEQINEQCSIQEKMETLRNRIDVKLTCKQQKRLFKMEIKTKIHVT